VQSAYQCLYTHIFQKYSVILFSLKLLISISVFFHREQLGELSQQALPQFPFPPVPVAGVTVGQFVKAGKSLLPLEIPASPQRRLCPSSSVGAEARAAPWVPKPEAVPVWVASCRMAGAAAGCLPLHSTDGCHGERPQGLAPLSGLESAVQWTCQGRAALPPGSLLLASVVEMKSCQTSERSRRERVWIL